VNPAESHTHDVREAGQDHSDDDAFDYVPLHGKYYN
jgi:hypothetical protein